MCETLCLFFQFYINDMTQTDHTLTTHKGLHPKTNGNTCTLIAHHSYLKKLAPNLKEEEI